MSPIVQIIKRELQGNRKVKHLVQNHKTSERYVQKKKTSGTPRLILYIIIMRVYF
jgi:septation ring formation regulator EzrA